VKNSFVIILCFILLEGYSQANHPTVPFEHITVPGTINSSQVNDLIQDHHGLIWVAGDGLFKYDGYKFTHYKQLTSGESIGGKEINYLFPDKHNNRLLIATHSYGLVEYDYRTNQLRAVPSKNGVPILGYIAQTNDGRIWASSFSNGLYFLEGDTLRRVEDTTSRFKNATSLLAIGNTLLVDKLKTIYVLRGKSTIDSIQIQFPGVDFPAATRVTTMTVDHDGNIWMGTERAGVLVYDTLKKVFVKHLNPESTPFFNRINRIMVDSKNNVWILTKSNGIAIYGPKSDRYLHIVRNPLSESSLSGNNCTSILEDKTGIIWVGSTGDLNKYDPSKLKFRHIYNDPLSKFSLSDNMVRGIYEDRSGKLWVGTDGGILHIFDRKKITTEKIEVKLKSQYQHIVALYFQELNDNIMLIGTSVGLLQFDRRAKTFEYFKPVAHLTENKQVRQVLISNNTLYFLIGGSLTIFNLDTNEVKTFNQYGSHNVPATNGTVMYLDRLKRLWIGASTGLSLFEPEIGTFRHFPFELNSNRPLGTYFMVLSIEEYDNKMWVGTFNSGLWSMDLTNLDNPAIITLTEKDGLVNNTVYSTIPDSNGNLWISTNQGVSKFETKTGYFTNFSSGDGLQQEEFNRLAYFKCANGDIVFGGINGLNIFNPKNITIQDEPYEPKFLNASVYNLDANESNFKGLLNQTTLTLKSDQNDLDISFFVPNFRFPRRFDVFYKLEGYNPEWVKTESNIIHYSNLKSGEHTLHLKTISGTNIERLNTLTISIQYPFWQTWWFIFLSVGVVTFMVYTIIQNNIRKSRRDKDRLEKLLRQRTEEIEKSKEALTNLNQKKDLIFSILSHDLRSPLTTLKGFLSILIDDSDHLTKEDIKKHASSIRNSVTSSLDLIDNTLFWSLSQTGNITYTPTVFSLDEMLTKIGNLYQLTAEKKKIQFTVTTQDKLMIHGDENMVYVTLRNLVSNALKFTPQGRSVKIETKQNHKFAEILICDEGVGMSPSYLEKLLAEEQLPVMKGTSNEKGTGLGLILCKKFIHMNNGHLEVNSVEGEGTEFLVKLPLA
jgi:signal transduction histidine kinase/ligand-binding sensor domain-containing protein